MREGRSRTEIRRKRPAPTTEIATNLKKERERTARGGVRRNIIEGVGGGGGRGRRGRGGEMGGGVCHPTESKLLTMSRRSSGS